MADCSKDNVTLPAAFYPLMQCRLTKSSGRSSPSSVLFDVLCIADEPRESNQVAPRGIPGMAGTLSAVEAGAVEEARFFRDSCFFCGVGVGRWRSSSPLASLSER